MEVVVLLCEEVVMIAWEKASARLDGVLVLGLLLTPVPDASPLVVDHSQRRVSD